MAFFRYGDTPEYFGYFIESFLFGNLGEARVHLGRFVMFTGRGGLQILQRTANSAGRKRRCYFHFAAL